MGSVVSNSLKGQGRAQDPLRIFPFPSRMVRTPSSDKGLTWQGQNAHIGLGVTGIFTLLSVLVERGKEAGAAPEPSGRRMCREEAAVERRPV